MKFKVGDIVKANSDNYVFTIKSNGWIGRVTKIGSTYFRARTIECKDKGSIGNEYWDLKYEDFDSVSSDSEIHITTDGKTTTAILKESGKVVKRATARCNPADDFDFSIGCRLAFNRLLGVEVDKKFDFSELKPGDRIKLKDSFDGLRNLAKDMLEYRWKVVTVASKNRTGVRIKEDYESWFWNDWFIEDKVKETKCQAGYVPETEDHQKFKVGDRVKTCCGTGEVLCCTERYYGVGIKGLKGHSLDSDTLGNKIAVEKGYDRQCWWFSDCELEPAEELTDKGFQKGKVYVFRKSRYLKALRFKETSVEWVNQCDGRIVEVIDNCITQLGSRNIQPAYCEEIGNV